MTVSVSDRLPSNWWLALLEGIAALILGVLLIAAPKSTVTTIVLFIGIFWLVDGILSFIRIFVRDTDTHWGWLLLRGLLGIIAGILVLRHPLVSAVVLPATLVVILGVEGLIIGVIGLIQAFKGGGWGAGVLALVNILFGIILLSSPMFAVFLLPYVFGFFAIIGGIMLIIFAFRIRRLAKLAAAT
jgi:uncharacterized membrane protein HdeD (DUF308 family)